MEQRPRPAGRAGFVLVGGNSTRMGRDKALLPCRGATLVECVAAQVEAAAGSVALVGHPERYRALRYRLIPDLSPDCGPLGGLEAALSDTEAEWNLVVACDMPAVTAQVLASLLERAERCGGDCLVPVAAGRPQPLCAAYHRRCQPGIRAAMRRQVRQMTEVVAGLNAVLWPVAEAAWFQNLNTPGDWASHCSSGLPARRHVP